MGAFDELGAAVERAWQDADLDERAFPRIAAAALREARLHELAGAADVVRWVLEAPALPEQDDIEATFGDPPVTVYQGRRFYVQALLWREGSTATHRHGFCGAFAVLEGSSLHARYAFEERRRVSSRMRLGDLRLRDADVIERGHVEEITYELIHTLFHLEAPAATIVVRTSGGEEGTPQHSYFPPSLALDPFHVDPRMTRRLQALRFARRTGQPDAPALAEALIAGSDLHTAYLVLEQAHLEPGGAPPGGAGRLVEAARRRHGAVVDELVAALEEALRRRKLRRLRAETTDPAHRFFLALLQALPHRDAIYAAIRRRHPAEDPRALAGAWLAALSGTRRIGVDLRDDLNRRIVSALLDGCAWGEVLDRLRRELGAARVDAQEAALARHCERIRRTALAPLLRAADGGGAAGGP